MTAERARAVREARGVAGEAAHHRPGRCVRKEAQPKAAARRPRLRLRPLLRTGREPPVSMNMHRQRKARRGLHSRAHRVMTCLSVLMWRCSGFGRPEAEQGKRRDLTHGYSTQAGV